MNEEKAGGKSARKTRPGGGLIDRDQILLGIIGEAEAALRKPTFETHLANIRNLSFILSDRIRRSRGLGFFCPNFDRLHPDTQKEVFKWAKRKGIRLG